MWLACSEKKSHYRLALSKHLSVVEHESKANVVLTKKSTIINTRLSQKLKDLCSICMELIL